MNERIEKISEQARQYADSMYPSGLDIAKWGPAYQEKFAELIVQECAKVAYKYTESSVYNDDYDDVGWECLPGDLRTHIKEHFGVEE